MDDFKKLTEQLLKIYINAESVNDFGIENYFDENISLIGTGKHETSALCVIAGRTTNNTNSNIPIPMIKKTRLTITFFILILFFIPSLSLSILLFIKH